MVGLPGPAWRSAVAIAALGFAWTVALPALPARAQDAASASASASASADSASGAATLAAAGAAPSTDDREAAARADRERVHNTWLGPAGGLHVADAGTGNPGSMRLQLALDFFGTSDYLAAGDEHHGSAGTLSLGYTLLEYLELFGSVGVRSNYNSKGRTELLQVVGDMSFGAKGVYQPLPWLALGGDLGVFIPSGVGDVSVGFAGTSVGLRGNVTADLRRVGSGVPLIGRFGAGYYFDQSANLIEDVEDARYAALNDPRPRADEDRHLVTRQERLAFGINRVDRFDLELGLEAPLKVVKDFYIHPIVEWRLGVPVNRQGYDCLSVPTDADDNSPDGCLEQQGLSAMPMTMSLGARFFPWLTGFALTLGVDVGLTGAHTFVRELAPNRPWAFLVAFGYAHEPGRKPEPTAAVAAKGPLIPWRARIDGVVVDSMTEMPIAAVEITYLHREPTAQVSDEEGRFLSYPFESGEVRMQLRHPDYQDAECLALLDVATLQPGAEQRLAVRCTMDVRPKLGALDGTVKSASDGAALPGVTVRLTGPHTVEVTTVAGGKFEITELPPGAYELEVNAPAHQSSKRPLLVPGGAPVVLEVLLQPVAAAATPAPSTSSNVKITKRAVVIKRAVHFRHNSTELELDSHTLLDEVAATLVANPELLRVEVQGHTDNRGQPGVNRALSQGRADSVRDYLVQAGVPSDRLTAKGYGDSRPLVPNLTDKNRARNRRVEFIILERAK